MESAKEEGSTEAADGPIAKRDRNLVARRNAAAKCEKKSKKTTDELKVFHAAIWDLAGFAPADGKVRSRMESKTCSEKSPARF